MKRTYFLTTFISLNLFLFGRTSEEVLDNIANYYFNEVEESFYPNWDDNFIEMNVRTEGFHFMDELIAYINETLDTYPTSIYSTEEMRNGVYNITTVYYPYGNVENCYNPYNNMCSHFLYSDEFKANGSYIINVWFNKKVNIQDNINFKYNGFKFATSQFLLPFFTDITDISIYPLHDCFEDGHCSWNFIVLCGHIIKAQYSSEESFMSTVQVYPEKSIQIKEYMYEFYDLATKQPITDETFRQCTVPYLFPVGLFPLRP